MPLDAALPSVTESSRAIAAQPTKANCLLLRYEDGFAENPETVDAIAAYLDLAITSDERDAVYDALAPAAVREMIAPAHRI